MVWDSFLELFSEMVTAGIEPSQGKCCLPSVTKGGLLFGDLPQMGGGLFFVIGKFFTHIRCSTASELFFTRDDCSFRVIRKRDMESVVPSFCRIAEDVCEIPPA